MSDNYEDIINLPHHVSIKHPHMKMIDRAAQFSPFAALTGHGSAVAETVRLTQEYSEPDEYEKNIINEKLRFLSDCIARHPEAEITYFEPDKRKNGGEYLTASGRIGKFDSYNRYVIMEDGRKIAIDFISDINCASFEKISADL
ncbi:MAG: hypothetical protein IKB88_06295 [Clostridia bacterium]|nr:hypothetical protein [Clostridia bacterium]